MNQLTLSDVEYSNRRKKTKREEFLDAMEEIIPWSYMMHGGTIVDAGSGYVHTITGTSANMHDVTETYRGVAKNMHHMLFTSANLLMCSRAGRTKEFIGCTV